MFLADTVGNIRSYTHLKEVRGLAGKSEEAASISRNLEGVMDRIVKIRKLFLYFRKQSMLDTLE